MLNGCTSLIPGSAQMMLGAHQACNPFGVGRLVSVSAGVKGSAPATGPSCGVSTSLKCSLEVSDSYVQWHSYHYYTTEFMLSFFTLTRTIQVEWMVRNRMQFMTTPQWRGSFHTMFFVLIHVHNVTSALWHNIKSTMKCNWMSRIIHNTNQLFRLRYSRVTY